MATKTLTVGEIRELIKELDDSATVQIEVSVNNGTERHSFFLTAYLGYNIFKEDSLIICSKRYTSDY